MSLFNTSPTIVIRASDDADPDAAGYDTPTAGYESIELAFKVPFIQTIGIGEAEVDIAYNERGPKLKRYRMVFSLLELYVQAAQGTRFQTVAAVQKFTRLTREYDYVWLYRVYQQGGNHGAGNFLWASEDGNDAMFNLTTDPNPGICPHRVTRIGDVSMSPPSGGLIKSEITLQSMGVV